MTDELDKSLLRMARVGIEAREKITQNTDSATILPHNLSSKRPEENILSIDRAGSDGTPPVAFSRITLEEIDKNLFLGRKEYLWKPQGRSIVFGGQVVGQSLAAAIRTVTPEKHLHSMHCYFLAGGRNDVNIVHTVLPIREGKSFATRMVMAQQQGRTIYVMICSFQRLEITSLNHQSTMPLVPSPEFICPAEEFFLNLKNDPRCPKEWVKPLELRAKRERENPIETRFVLVHDFFSNLGERDPTFRQPDYPKYTNESKQILWIKTRHRLPDDDQNIHRSVLAYASDMFLLSTAVGAEFNIPEIAMMASRDHSMWFHSDFRMDEWMLYELESPRAGGARGLSLGKIYRRDGTLAVTCSQEGVIRLRKDMEAKTKSGPATSKQSNL